MEKTNGEGSRTWRNNVSFQGHKEDQWQLVGHPLGELVSRSTPCGRGSALRSHRALPGLTF